jgi:glyoxylase-like metal-dependent hydrolase (beta-lactamase superfamily II)
VDQQHRIRGRPARGVQHRRVLYRAAHPGLPRGHQERHPGAGSHPRQHPPPRRSHPDVGQLPLEPPFLTFTDEIALHAGDTRITVRHVGTAAHTTNDVLAWFPAQSVLFCGDLVFNGGTPFLLMGSVAGCIEALEKVVLAPGRPRPRGRRPAAAGRRGHRPRPVRRLAGRRAPGREPAPRLRGAGRNPARRADRRHGRASGHGRLQRRQAADLRRLRPPRTCLTRP